MGIDNQDPLGFDEVISSLEGEELDVLFHSPGGSPEAAEAIVSLLRSRFSNIRFIVPHMAKSAATMICCSGNEVLMDDRSELGPIDPQLLLTRGDGRSISAPAHAILKQIDKAKQSLADNPKEITAWLPILQPLGPSLLTECESANNLSLILVEDWLKNYMFSEEANKDKLASTLAKFLANSGEHLSHARRIDIGPLKDNNMRIVDLREIPKLRDAIWNLYLAIHWTFQDTAAYKIIENGGGIAFIRQIIIQPISVPLAPPLPIQQEPQQPTKNPKTRKRHK